jgi:hypothetical protein
VTINDEMHQITIPPTPGSRVPLPNLRRPSSRTYLLVAVVLVVVVITVSTFAQSSVSKSFAAAQQHYQRDVTPVEEADVIFNGGASTPPDHSSASIRTLELALGKEFNELHAQKWPKVAAADISKLAFTTRAEYRLLLTLQSVPNNQRSAIFNKQSILLNDIEITNVNILKELKLPTPTNVSRPAAPPTKVP